MNRFRERRCRAVQTLAVLALSGTCCSVMAAGVPTGPAELAPTDLIGRLGQSSLAIDVTGDCRVSELDIILNAIAATQSVSDADGDGVLTYQDRLADMEQLVRRSVADFDNDGLVSDADVFHVLEVAAFTGDVEADVNLDGITDLSDVLITADRVGIELAPATDQVAETLLTYADYVRQFDATSLLATCAGGTTASDHSKSISETYPSDHGSGFSGWYPGNHMFTITSEWPRLPRGHNGVISQGTHFINFSQYQWPPNHSYAVSKEWGVNPGDHSSTLSEEWKHQPDHRAEVSKSWPPPEKHDNSISRTFPPNHKGDLSAQRRPTPHATAVSGTWHDGSTSSNSHDTAFSAKWPTNHSKSVSGSWPGSQHHGGVSAMWPPNHHSAASTTWPPQTFPQWPPTHFATVSADWGNPVPGPWPVFPPDHSWWTTATDVVQLIPSGK
jgi:hypothetical protein